MNENAQNLAARLAALLQETPKDGDGAMRASLEKISQRLDTIEARLDRENSKPKTQNPQPFHLSQEKFKSLEALADEIIAGLSAEKDCPYEPTAKPCDNCAMCNSRGF